MLSGVINNRQVVTASRVKYGTRPHGVLPSQINVVFVAQYVIWQMAIHLIFNPIQINDTTKQQTYEMYLDE